MSLFKGRGVFVTEFTLEDLKKFKGKVPVTTLPFSAVCGEYYFLNSGEVAEELEECFVDIKKVAGLFGKKFSGKRGKLRKFKELYKDWSFIRITEDNLNLGYEVEKNFQGKYSELTDRLGYRRSCFREFTKLSLDGWLLKIGDSPIGYAIVAPVGEYGVCLLAMHSLEHFPGASTAVVTMLCQQLLELYPKLLWFNFGSFTSSEERQIALSYQPEISQSYLGYIQTTSI